MSTHNVNKQRDTSGMYSMRRSKTGDLQITSRTTGKSYGYVRDPDRASLKAAILNLSADDRAHRTAAAQRPVVTAPVPTHDDKVAAVEHATKRTPQTADERIQAFENHVNSIVPRTSQRADKAHAKRRVDAMTRRLLADQEIQDQRLAREALASSPEVLEQIKEAQETYDRLALKGDVPAELVEAAKSNLDALKSDLDVGAAVERADAIGQAYQADRTRQILALRETILKQEQRSEQLHAEILALAPPAE